MGYPKRDVLSSRSPKVVCTEEGDFHLPAEAFAFAQRKDGAASDIDSRLKSMIEQEIIPLMALGSGMERRNGAAFRRRRDAEVKPTPADVEELARLVLSHETRVATNYVETLRGDGISLEVLLLELLAPTARLLGDYWVNDTRDFAEVTIGLGRLQQLMHELTRSAGGEPPIRVLRERRLALVVAAPGEQHTFGAVMVADFFRRGGWDVVGGHTPDEDEIADLVRYQEFDMIGLSLSCDSGVERLEKTIGRVRDLSRQRDITVMVGGRVFNDDPELAATVGADMTGADGRMALRVAEQAVSNAANW
ncbi:MAG: B12-binding domain-containing protein [Minwuia sp.]|uniref:cobalamin B12-binding domain-containing protein n=1 Tax=Minwuia sp. TaxID=2493630 RepID=UPI003A8B5572